MILDRPRSPHDERHTTQHDTSGNVAESTLDVSMTTRKRRTRRTNASNDEAQARIAIHLQRMAVDLAAARKELHRLYGPGIDEEIDMLAAMGRNIKIIHNRHSHIKQS